MGSHAIFSPVVLLVHSALSVFCLSSVLRTPGFRIRSRNPGWLNLLGNVREYFLRRHLIGRISAQESGLGLVAKINVI